MLRRTETRTFKWTDGCALVLAGVVALGVFGCDKGPALSKTEQFEDSSPDEMEMPDLGSVDGELLIGALIDQAPIYSAAHKKAPVLGYLHAGDRIGRSEKSHANEHCIDGWYSVSPKGYICTEKAATTDLEHPTLLAMALSPNLDASLPYAYARTTKVTALLKNNGQKGVELTGRLAKSTVMAIVGSWTAPDESHEPQRLGLKLDGHFVRVDDLEAAKPSSFAGVELSGDSDGLPVGFVVRRGVRRWELDGNSAKKADELKKHDKLDLTGRYRTIEGEKFWAEKSGTWVRYKDVTVILPRHSFPEFVTETQKWLDVSVITGTLIAYEGKKPVFATLMSVGRDRLGDPETSASTALGDFRVVEKHITRRPEKTDATQVHDSPWAVKLESGQWLVSSPRHNRFGIEHTDGDIEVSPADGARLFRWITPGVPVGWHGVVVTPDQETTVIHVRK